VNLVPALDKDGTSTGGIRLPDIEAPLGTYLGWNPRNAAIGNPGYLARWDGSFFMFAQTEAEREKTSDPRPSIAQRYKNQGQYVRAIEQAAVKLRKEGLLLDEDVQAMSERARQMVWPPVPIENYPFWQMRP
jgi:Alpha/beta hydrolase domain